MTRVGFAGLGRMGAPMACNIAAAGHALSVWNRDADKADSVAGATGATVCPTPRVLASESDVVVTMLADDAASAAVHHGPDGLFAAAGGAVHFVEMGTLSPSHIGDLAAAAGTRTLIDAPVSGSVDAAVTARLLIMAGADDDTIAPLRDVLETMGRPVISLGHQGAGATMKLAVNVLIHGLNQSVAEALALAGAAGIADEDAYAVFERSAAAAPMLGYRKPQYLDEAGSPVTFTVSLAEKDLTEALRLGDAVGVAMPQSRLNRDQLSAADRAGLGDHDMAALLTYLRDDR
jgi:3-hydroxyisobutyrate dehydrogenase